jgi:hypothetical protein
MVAGPLRFHATLGGRPSSKGAEGRTVGRIGSTFIREVNMALGGMIVAAVVLAGAHYVSLVHEMRRVRQDLCSANLALLVVRNPYLKLEPRPADACAALTTLTGERVTMPAARRSRSGV